jgi:hypothetical protein
VFTETLFSKLVKTDMLGGLDVNVINDASIATPFYIIVYTM